MAYFRSKGLKKSTYLQISGLDWKLIPFVHWIAIKPHTHVNLPRSYIYRRKNNRRNLDGHGIGNCSACPEEASNAIDSLLNRTKIHEYPKVMF
jgi:hypothetical protein